MRDKAISLPPRDRALPVIAGMAIADWLPPVLLAPFIGSFLGVLIVRLPEHRPIFISRSVCDHCGQRLMPRDLVPLLSYWLLRGRCRHCQAAIGHFFVAIECAALAVALWAAVSVPGDELWVTCGFGWTLLTLAWIDVRTMLLPNGLTLPLLVAGLTVTAIDDPPALVDHVVAAILGYLALAGLAWAYRRWRGRDGLGMGDAKLLAAIGAWLGLLAMPFTVFLAAFTGILAASVAMLAGRRMTATTALPFGPFLALAAWLCWLYGPLIDDLLLLWNNILT